MTEESIVYWIGAAVFGVASLAFAALYRRQPRNELIFRSDVFVSFITTISYVVMALALGTVMGENGQPVYWTRWLFYVASCSILTLDIAFVAQKPSVRKVEVLLFTGLTMFCGFLASFIVTADRWWFFALSTAAYIGMLYTLFHRSTDGEINVTSIMWFVAITWSLFPLVWVLAPTGLGFITTFVEAGLYGILDFTTKIAFGAYTSLNYKSG